MFVRRGGKLSPAGERERERESVFVCEGECVCLSGAAASSLRRAREGVFVCESECVCLSGAAASSPRRARERERVSVCERE